MTDRATRYGSLRACVPVLLVLAAFAGSRAHADSPTPGEAGNSEMDELARKLLGSEKRIRDSVSFRTERDEPAALVLYVTDLQAVVGDRVDVDQPLSCTDAVIGIPLKAVYGLALIIGDDLVNEITIPGPGGGEVGAMELPLRNLPFYNYTHWGQGSPVENDPEARHTEPTKLLRLADYNGDGKALELRLVQAGPSCGHLATLVAGYSPRRRAAVIFPAFSGPFRSEWSDNLFPSPTAAAGPRLESTFACDDQGNDREVWQEHLYDAEREAWVLHRHRERPCKAESGSAEPSDAKLASPLALVIESAEGAPGEHVSIAVSIDVRDAPVGRLEHAIVVDPRISVAAIEGLDFERADGGATAAEQGVGPINCASDLVESCQWALSMRLDGNFEGKPKLYFLNLAIPPDAVPGVYRLSNVNAAALDRSGKKIAIDGKDGELTVRAAGATSEI